LFPAFLVPQAGATRVGGGSQPCEVGGRPAASEASGRREARAAATPGGSGEGVSSGHDAEFGEVFES
jgi:hypothetical protein